MSSLVRSKNMDRIPVGTDSYRDFTRSGYRAAIQTGAVILRNLVWHSRSLMDFQARLLFVQNLKAYLSRCFLGSLIKHGFNQPILLDGIVATMVCLDILIEDLMLETGKKVATCPCLGSCESPQAIRDSRIRRTWRLVRDNPAMLYLVPECVDQSVFADCAPEADLDEIMDRFSLHPPVNIQKARLYSPMMMSELYQRRPFHGDPRLASTERGEALINAKANALADFIHQLKDGKVKLEKLKGTNA